jgi:hypothetical protein
METFIHATHTTYNRGAKDDFRRSADRDTALPTMQLRRIIVA